MNWLSKCIFLVIAVNMVGCVRYSRDEIPDINNSWRSDSYLIEQNGNSGELLIKQAKIFLEKGDYSSAWNRLTRPVFRYVSNPELSFLKGKTAYRLEDYEAARRFLEDAQELGYTGDELFYLIVANDLALGDAQSAIGAVNTLLQLQEKPAFVSLKGDVLLQTGDTVNALKEYRRSMRSDSSIRANYMGMAIISMKNGDLEQSLELLNSWLKSNPDDREFLMLKSGALEELNDYQQAGNIYASLPEQQDPALLTLRARNYLLQRKADSAVILANQAIVYKDSLATRMILARALERQRQYTAAENEYRNIVERDSTQAEAAQALKRLVQRRQYMQYLREQQSEQETPEESLTPSDSTAQ
jgi:tetratricopeptide (TPR) repeat protein